MTSYLISNFEIVDEARFNRYVAAVMPLLSKHRGRVLVADKGAQALEGPPPGMNVVIEFPSEADARAFYDDPEYQPVKAVRLGSTANRNAVHSPGFIYEALRTDALIAEAMSRVPLRRSLSSKRCGTA